MRYHLFYAYASDYMEQREKFHSEHLTLAWYFHARGALILAGVVADPYVKYGLVMRWPWNTLVAANASNPDRFG